jgi:hypothetical protein
MKKWSMILIMLLVRPVFAQTIMDQGPQFFSQTDTSITGRIRQLTVEQVIAGPEKEIVTMNRNGEFPDWHGILTVWKYNKTKIEKVVEWEMPKETILYGFIPNGTADSSLVLVLPNQVRIGQLKQNQWVFDATQTMSIRSFAEIPYGSLAQPFDPMVNVKTQPTWFWVPTLDGYQIYSYEKNKIVQKQIIPLKPKSFYQSSHDLLPFEFQYWFRNVYWFPNVVLGALGSTPTPTFFSPWMDEVSMIEFSGNQQMQERKHYFKLLTEDERDDGIHYIVNRPVDLNGDGQTDFLINKFMGTGTAFRAQNYYYIARPDGTIPATGKSIKIDLKKAAGAIVEDLDKNGKQDFIIVSAMFNVWSMVRALMKKQVLMEFDFYKYKTDEKPYDFNKADLHQEVLFDFHLGDLFIDGILPTLEGDFNGDGYPDIFYARNRQALSFLIQRPKETPFLPAQPSGTFTFNVPKKYRIGDLNGDGKDDLVFFNTRDNKNRKFTVLINKGLLK